MTNTHNAMETHRIVVSRRGGPEVLTLQSDRIPEPSADEARVRVEFAGISAYDIMLRGHRFPGFPALPYTPGEDFVGIVEATGANVDHLQVGQRVGGWTFGEAGGYAEHICRPTVQLVPVPDELDPAIAVALIANYLTAHLALHENVKVQPGERLLVQGAGGGLGSALLQLGRLADVETYGCDSVSKHRQIVADGAMPFDYRDQDVIRTIHRASNGGMDVVIDVVGGPAQLVRSYKTLRRGGRLLMLGMAGTARFGTRIILPSLVMTAVLAVWPDGRHITSGAGMETYPQQHLDWYRRTLEELFQLAAQGDLDPHVATRVPLGEAARAHRMLEKGRVAGKLVLEVNV